jgi:hypothetical protein
MKTSTRPQCTCESSALSTSGGCLSCNGKNALQAKLTLGRSDDPFEREADQVADRVLAAPSISARNSSPRGRGPGADADLGPGRALDASTRTSMESRFGHDFSQVRVHADGRAAAAAHGMRAQAYTVGPDLVFGAGRYAPETQPGRHLLAHELGHVVQQARGGHDGDTEARADAAADRVTQGHRVSPGALGGAPSGLQAKPEDAPTIPAPVFAFNNTLASEQFEAADDLSKLSPKLVRVASSYKTNAGSGKTARVSLSAYLPERVQNSSAQETTERNKLGARMRAVRDVLESLGVPNDMIDVSPATAYSTSANGQVSIDVATRNALNLAPQYPPPPAPFAAPPTTSPAGASLPSLDLDFKWGPLELSLPKEVRVKLPIPLRGSKALVIDLGAAVPGKFSLKITVDGTPYVHASLKAGAEIDPKSGAVSGSAGLQIDTVASVCLSPDPGETREKIQTAGDKLNKAAQEFQAASGTDKLGKAFDIAGAIGEIYDAVDKAKGKCKQVPRITLDIGYKRLVSPGDETDPTKLPPVDAVGATATFHF